MLNAKFVKAIDDRKLYQNRVLLLESKFDLQSIEINVESEADEDSTEEVIFIQN